MLYGNYRFKCRFESGAHLSEVHMGKLTFFRPGPVFSGNIKVKNCFRRSSTGDLSKIEGGYSGSRASTRFNVLPTARTEDQRNAVLADLCDSIGQQ